MSNERSGMGCFAKGCLTLIVVIIALVAVLVGGGYYYYGKVVDTLTSDKPREVKLEQVSEPVFNAAANKYNTFVNAVNNGQEATVEFSAADLNALVARHPDFTGLRGKARFDISESILGFETSLPLDSAPDLTKMLTRLKGRYFNGRIRTGLEYVNGEFIFSPKLIEANEMTVPSQFLTDSAIAEFNKSFNQSFQEKARQNSNGSKSLQRVKSLRVTGDKVVVVVMPK